MSKLGSMEIQAYTSKLNTLSQATRDVVAKLLSQIEYTDVADLRNQLIEILEPFLAASTDTAAAYAAEFFELAHTTATGTPYTAQSVSGRDPKTTNEAIRALVNPINQGKTLADITNSLLERVDYEIKKTAAETVYKNAERDEACTGWARVPTGRDTCTFCLMLASRGFAYKSEANAGKYDHFHANCDCRIIPGFDGMEVEGYDPDALYDQWKELEQNKTRSRQIAESKKVYDIPREKIVGYSLKNKDKAIAFKNALGYTVENADKLIDEIYLAAALNPPTYRDADQWGKRYTGDYILLGENGKSAKVKTGWIVDKSGGKMRLVTAYVDK